MQMFFKNFTLGFNNNNRVSILLFPLYNFLILIIPIFIYLSV